MKSTIDMSKRAMLALAAASSVQPIAAAGPATLGTFHTLADRDVRIHTYVSPPDGFGVATQIVEGPASIVIFDCQLLDDYAEEAAQFVRRLGKPVDRIVVSHAHPDHWAGLGVFTRHFPSARVHALPEVKQAIAARGDAILASLKPVYGDRIAGRAIAPDKLLDVGRRPIDGIDHVFSEVTDAESDRQLVAALPTLDVVFAFDLVFHPSDHLFILLPTFDHWIEILERLKTEFGQARLFVGHGRPTRAEAIGATQDYLARARLAYVQNADAAGYAASLRAAFPNRENAQWLDFSSKLLYKRERPAWAR